MPKFLHLPFRTQCLFAEAMVTSAGVKLCLCFLPSKYVLRFIGGSNTESERTPDEQSIALRKNITSALYFCRRRALWPTECYTLALTGKLLLNRRRISSTVYVGFIKDPQGNYKGHAWLRARDTYITGYRESAGYTANFIFS